jgi:thiol-disulfide isomerase/thioredoxin
MIRFLSGLFGFVFAVSLCVSSTAHAASQGKSVEMKLPSSIADSLPWFAIREVSDNMLPFTRTHLSKISMKNERTALVYFATWCIPCRAGIKRLVDNYAELQKNNVSVVLVNIGERDEELVKSWVKKTNVSKFTVVSDPFKRLTEGFGLVKEGEEISLPRTIVLDKNTKPLFMLGEEGNDWPQVLWTK